ncbi:MAG: TIGR01906 family membrane protein [Anaerolineae bacterium]|nr:TIGR01906 family membrane protein [Anaerolineae bacterium]
MTNTSPKPSQATLTPRIVTALRWLIILIMPAFLVLTSVRIVSTEVFLWIEYHRPGFPDDPYGFTREERLEYGPYGVRYMVNDAGIGYLGDLELDGAPLFREKELEHMEDVKVVTRVAFRVQLALSALLLAAVTALSWRRETRHDLRLALSGGGVFTFGLIITLVMLTLAAWDMFFDGFHEVFFADGTWRFYNHDTLIRLYPEQFWFDAAITIGVLTMLGAGSLVWGAWRYAHRPTTQNGATVDPVEHSQPDIAAD